MSIKPKDTSRVGWLQDPSMAPQVGFLAIGAWMLGVAGFSPSLLAPSFTTHEATRGAYSAKKKAFPGMKLVHGPNSALLHKCGQATAN